MKQFCNLHTQGGVVKGKSGGRKLHVCWCDLTVEVATCAMMRNCTVHTALLLRTIVSATKSCKTSQVWHRPYVGYCMYRKPTSLACKLYTVRQRWIVPFALRARLVLAPPSSKRRRNRCQTPGVLARARHCSEAAAVASCRHKAHYGKTYHHHPQNRKYITPPKEERATATGNIRRI